MLSHLIKLVCPSFSLVPWGATVLRHYTTHQNVVSRATFLVTMTTFFFSQRRDYCMNGMEFNSKISFIL